MFYSQCPGCEAVRVVAANEIGSGDAIADCEHCGTTYNLSWHLLDRLEDAAHPLHGRDDGVATEEVAGTAVASTAWPQPQTARRTDSPPPDVLADSESETAATASTLEEADHAHVGQFPIIAPASTDPEVVEPDVAESDEVFEPDSVEPDSVEPNDAMPRLSSPTLLTLKLLSPKSLSLRLSSPSSLSPEVVEPDVAELEVVEPDVAEPEVVESEVAEPEVVEPDNAEPEATVPEPAADAVQAAKQGVLQSDDPDAESLRVDADDSSSRALTTIDVDSTQSLTRQDDDTLETDELAFQHNVDLPTEERLAARRARRRKRRQRRRQEKRMAQTRARYWAIGSIVLVLLVALQLRLFYLDILNRSAVTRPIATALCAVTSCAAERLPRDLSMFEVNQYRGA